MLRGIATVSFWAEDVAAARTWYTALLGIEPYFQRPDAEHPAYIEFRVGEHQFELGIVDARYAPPGAAADPGGATVYWHVDDIEVALRTLTSMGAKEYEPITQRGEGFVTASVVDPFGNLLGVMFNPHYVETLGAESSRGESAQG